MKNLSDPLRIGDKSFSSRLMLGTGKYRTSEDAIESIKTSECEIVTVAIRRLPTNLNNDNTTFLKHLDWESLWLLPNTAGSQTASRVHQDSGPLRLPAQQHRLEQEALIIGPELLKHSL